MSLEGNKEVIRRHFEQMWNERDLDVVPEITAADYVEHGIAPLRRSTGPRPDPIESMKGTVRWLTAAFPDLRFAIDDVIAEGEKVVAYVTMRGTHQGEFQGIAATGKEVEAKAVHIFRLVGGKAVEHWAVRDDLTVLLQLGVRALP